MLDIVDVKDKCINKKKWKAYVSGAYIYLQNEVGETVMIGYSNTQEEVLDELKHK